MTSGLSTNFAHLTIATADVDATTAFFADVMRWQEIPVPANVEIKVCWLDIGSGGQLHVLEAPNSFPSDF